MPSAVKPCAGQFSEELQEVLNRNSERAQWSTYACEICKVTVGAVQVRGKWVPEPHWPSVKYTPRRVASKGQRRVASSA